MKYILIVSIILLASCKKDFLESTDTSNLNRQTYVNNLSTMEKYANGIQAMLLRDFQRGAPGAYGDLISDDIKVNLDVPRLLAQYSWSQKANSDNSLTVEDESLGMNGEWRNSYMYIRSFNFVIEEIDKYRNENPDKSDKILGQSYAFRALLHFKLANIFSQTYSFTQDASHLSVPYITTSDITVPYKRNTTFEVYEKMIEDLHSAIGLMKPGVPNTKEMNQDAAKSLLARIYLYRGDYVNAKKIALEVTSTHPLMTIGQGYPEKMYHYLPSSETESLYQLEPIYVLEPVFLVNYFVGSVYRGPYVVYRPTQDIITLIRENPKDIRNNWLTPDGANWMVSKYPIGITGINIDVPAADYYHTLFRSSEMFLTVAEAAFKTNDETTAREYLNAIRKRADPTIADIVATGGALLDSIYKERHKELAFEGGRMFDLQRWHKAVVRVDPAVPSASTLTYPSNKAIAPIPIQDVNLAGIEQNTDY